jgi:hypothetical protein
MRSRDSEAALSPQKEDIMSRLPIGSGLAVLAIIGALAGAAAAGTSGASGYHPQVDPAKFTDRITNKYLPLATGSTHRYRGTRDGRPTLHVVTVTHQHRTVMGVRCVVVKDNVWQSQSLAERTTDWYAQDDAGNVWYFGEQTAELQNGVVTSTSGTWEAGVDRALPGIVMPAVPKVGRTYQEEFRPGVALDRATILGVNGTVKVPAGTYHQAVITFDKNPLDPSKKERKWYVAGVGFVHAVLHGGGHTEVTSLVK